MSGRFHCARRRGVSSFRILAALSLIVAFSSSSALAGSVLLYGSTGGAGGGEIYTIDPDTGDVTFIGDTGQDKLGGIDFDGSGVLYGVSGGSIGPAMLMTIDPNDASVNIIGPISGIQGVDALAFDADDTLYGGAWNGQGELITIDPGTGNLLTSVVLFGGGGNNFTPGLDFDGSGRLYGSRGNSAERTEDFEFIDFNTGQVTPIGGATAIISDIWFAPDGRLFGGSPDGSLYDIDPGTGNKTFLFNTGIDRLSGLTGIPEPATMGVLFVGGLLMLRRRRR